MRLRLPRCKLHCGPQFRDCLVPCSFLSKSIPEVYVTKRERGLQTRDSSKVRYSLVDLPHFEQHLSQGVLRVCTGWKCVDCCLERCSRAF